MEHLKLHDLADVNGLKLIESSPFQDRRGSVARIFCEREWTDLGFRTAQVYLSETWHKHVIRGMHYQPGQAKIVRCLSGKIVDVVLDVRQNSSTFGKWTSAQLSGVNRMALYIPAGCAHGFQTVSLEPVQLLYFFSEPYDPTTEKGVRWNDPKFKISWPFPPSVISTRDEAHPLWTHDAF
jgi:dTDP-4-dehydrorhamnose 3,5-epimerase